MAMICTWDTWTNVLIDFAAQLYMAWQIADGHAPYGEIAGTYKGPRSAHLNASWFQLFGGGFQPLIVVNLLILAGMICLICRLLSEIRERGEGSSATRQQAAVAFSRPAHTVCKAKPSLSPGLVLPGRSPSRWRQFA
jgi:hypothetical protein